MSLTLDKPGKTVLFMGNEAIVRGAIEAGVDFSSSYPGSPSSEIQENLAKTSKEIGHYAQWAVNEKVALEACIGASFGGMRAITSMKQNGINVASDILMTANLSGVRGGVLIVVCDDPQGHSSTNEMDSRPYVRFADLPLLEPSSAQEAKEMTTWAFDLSEQLKSIVLMRSVTRISHARANVKLGTFQPRNRVPSFGPGDRYLSLPPLPQHQKMHAKMAQAREIFEKSLFNEYFGPANPQKVIVACGAGVMYAREAIDKMGIGGEIGLMKIGTTWPLPEQLISKTIGMAKEWLVVEEVDPFLEENLKSLIIDCGLETRKVLGKKSGHVSGLFGAGVGEVNPDIVMAAIEKAWGYPQPPRRLVTLSAESQALLGAAIPFRELAFCPGCPHRTSFWITNQAVKLDGRNAIVMGDIGCYSMGAGRTGYFLPRTMHCMGSGIGFANGLSQIKSFKQPVMAFAGDSTFFHSCLPSLVNAKYNQADLTLIVLDNSATSMTGFQPHPGTGKNAVGDDVEPVDIAAVCRGIGVPTFVLDPFEVDSCTYQLTDLMQQGGLKVVIFRHPCALVEAKTVKKEDKPKVIIDAEICVGASCGCDRFCSRVFGCPALIWDAKSGHAAIDEVLCTRCGVCATVCPQGAIKIVS